MATALDASFAALLRRYRVAAGFSQETLAERAGLSTRAISDLERGARHAPYRETVRLLADALALAPTDRQALEAAVDRGRGPRAHEPVFGVQTLPALPAVVTRLIGRDHDVRTIGERLRNGDVRLLTLTGPPGIGKTRLALAVAGTLGGYRSDGVFFVGLAPIADSRLVATSIIQALGLADTEGRPAADRLKDLLRNREALLVLDNFEQVIGAAPLVGDLLEACPTLAVLVTSRIALRLRGEQEFPVAPLSLPDSPGASVDVKTVGGSSAVALFVERAQAVKPDFALNHDNAAAVVDVCRRLDGLPLAIELAAARCKVLTPRAMLGRFGNRLDLLTGGARDAPARQRALRAAIAWSHDLLSAEEQVLFRRLGVFVGGWTLETAECVCNATGDLGLDVLNGIASLVDQSLVQQTEGSDAEPRFFMLETLREYALERLDASDERRQLQRRHADSMLAFAEEAEPYLFGGDRGRWLRHLSEEQDNIRAALGWSLAQDEPELGMRLVGVLWMWFQRRLTIEGRQWADDLLAHTRAQRSTSARADALFAAGHFAWLQGDVRAFHARLGECVKIRRQLGDAAGLGRALPFLGLALGNDYRTAQQLAAEGVSLCREVGDRWGLALALTNLGRIEATWGHDTAARPPLEEATALFRSLRDDWVLALPLTSIGAIAYRAGSYEEARSAFEEALPRFRAIEDRRNTAQALTNLGYVTLADGEVDRAREIFAESLAFGREHGDRFNTPACLRGFAAAAVAVGDLVHAVRLFAAADELSAATGAPRWPAERLGGPVNSDALRGQLGDERS